MTPNLRISAEHSRSILDRKAITKHAAAACIALLVLAAGQARAATQSVSLQPGWNAVWLTVSPSDPRPSAVFENFPVAQVWCWFPTESPVEFINNPASDLTNVDGWRTYIPGTERNAFLSNLPAIQGHRAYLIKLLGQSPATLTISGSEAFKPITWRADSFNLVGFHVDRALGGGSAGAFFQNAPAHKGQSKHRLQANGEWTPMTDTTPIRAGEAYWIYANGSSHFDGPLGVQIEGGSLDFGTVVQTKRITLTNNSLYANNVTIDAGGIPLLTATESGGVTTWSPLTSITRSVPAGGKVALKLGAQRVGLTAAAQGTVTITAPGVTFPFAASVLPLTPGTVAALVPGRQSPRLPAAAGSPDTGLWVGSVTLNKVVDVNDAASGPVATPAEFTMRIILHVDSGGATRLLKQVVLMQKAGTTGDTPTFVLVTDDTRLPDFKGATLKDGQNFGYRVSAIGYDFAGNELPLNGSFGGSLAGTLVIDRSLATHPMKHLYHPDHDDLDGQFKPLANPPPANVTPDQQEVWKITRMVDFAFGAAPAGSDPAAATTRTGTYSETVTGLHKQDLIVNGTFTLRRVTQLGELNPVP